MFTTKKLFILILRNSLVALFFILATIVVIFFLKDKIENVTDSIALNLKLKAQLKERSELISVLENDIQIIGDNNTFIKESFPPSEDISKFIDSLDKLIEGETINQIYRFETPKPSSLSGPFPISSISYTNNINTDFSGLSSYLKKFENMPYFTKIENINISSQDKALGWLGQSNISLKAILLTKTTE